MSDSPTPLPLPSTLPYPITITRLLIKPSTEIQRGTKLLEYSFLSSTKRRELERKGGIGSEVKDDMVGSWESPISGTLVSWEKWIGDGLNKRIDKKLPKPIVQIQQPCSHPVQIHGLCGICGMDLTTDDYLSQVGNGGDQGGPSNYAEGAVGFEIAHDALGVTVSSNEAKRLENLTRDTLLSTRRLSLIVDLDQTIIHTTVDPTVGEWMSEIALSNSTTPSPSPAISSPSQPTSSSPDDHPSTVTISGTAVAEVADETTTPPGSPYIGTTSLPITGDSPPKQSRGRGRNPNEEALRDVAKFSLVDDLPAGYIPPRGSRGQLIQQEGRWYYTKPRPGLQGFMERMSELYEMHVYTMGTRSYADAICKVIDPTGKIFGGRVLSRDESGSMSSKSLTRLFPTDQSMVVVIDDRSDVWDDCPNLVKVVPYDFFLGIGDINGSFLPTQTVIPSSPSTSPSPAPSSSSASSPDPNTNLPTIQDSPSSIASSPLPATPSESLSTEEEGMLIHSKLLDDVSQARPLAKLQEELENESEGLGGDGSGDGSGVNTVPAGDSGALARAETPDGSGIGVAEVEVTQPKHRKQLLNNFDTELDRVSSILVNVHSEFYRAYDRRSTPDDIPMDCDAGMIISEMKSKILDGCHLVFSGVIPRHIQPESFELWRHATDFGAICHTQVNSQITHCVTATLGTEKTYKASKLPKAVIVWVEWLTKSIGLWERQPESLYIARPPNSQSQVGLGNGVGGEGSSQGGSSGQTGPEGQGAGVADTGQLEGEEETAQEFDENDFTSAAEGWDAAAQAELDAFLEGSSDYGGTEDGVGTDRGDDDVEASDVESAATTPGTPRKRVRYADEESLPLETFKDPSPDDLSPSPPHKRRKPFLLPAPSASDEIPESNRMTYKSSSSLPAEEQESQKQVESGTEGAEEDDEFALMLMESLGEVAESEAALQG